VCLEVKVSCSGLAARNVANRPNLTRRKFSKKRRRNGAQYICVGKEGGSEAQTK
jgi:hypothetical protein